ncbi:MAG: molybdate ABC transporter permease subunit [Deltaproteobacteria bacterium]|nr:molybdate ABC transporter permease subunit [Deltaproteobacteria bacterium]
MIDDAGIVAFTLASAAAATLLIAVPGVAAGYLLARHRGKSRGAIETLLSLPLVLPPTAVGLLLLQVFRPNGAIGRALAAVGAPVVFTYRGVIVATTVMAFPLLVRSARTAFEEVDPRLLDVARTLGATRFSAFRRVALPLARRGIVAGLLLAFSRGLGEFGATILVAGNIPGETQTLSLAIFHRTQLGDDPGAMRLVLVIVVIAFVAVWATELLTRKRAR